MIHNIYFSLLIPLGALLIILFVTRNQHLPKALRWLLAITPSIMLILALLSYIIFYFVGGGINEVILYHLTVGFGEIENVSEFMPLFLLAAGTLILSVALIYITYRWILNGDHQRYSSLGLLFIIPLFYFHPMSLDINAVIQRYLTKPTEADIAHFQSLNHEPDKISFQLPQEYPKKDIIFLFLEGVENTFYHDHQLFPDLMPNLQRIADHHLEFTEIHQLDATSNTITGTAASLCGVPLINRKSGHERTRKNTFLPNALCFGDILKENGYRNLFVTGYSKNFTNKSTFYEKHGFASNDIFGNDEIEAELPYPINRNSWLGGVFDADLFQFVYQKYDYLSQKDQPFSIVINTLDTHAQDGYLDEARCGDFHYPLYVNLTLPRAIHCTDRALGKFYEQLKNHPNAENTLLVIVSDHLLPLTTLTSTLMTAEKRRNTFIIVDFANPTPTKIERHGLQFDMLTTLLNYAGWPIEGLHFSRNLFNQKEETILEQFQTVQAVDETFSRWGRLFSYFWLPKKDD